MNYFNGDQIERTDAVLISFLEQCWQLEAAAPELDLPQLEPGLIQLDETRHGFPALSRSTVALWMPLLWLYL